MNYISVSFYYQPLQPWTDILVAYLSEIYFESFVENNSGMDAYIEEHYFDTKSIDRICKSLQCPIKYQFQRIEQENWNTKWETSFEPVIIDHFCGIRADFHSPLNVEFELVITPKMAFGTGHHLTTSGMIKSMRSMNLKSQKVLDMGCGTGVLAILAEKMGATSILAIDIDEWAYQNAKENIQKNNCQYIQLEKGGSEKIEGVFNCILANINRNILINDLSTYATHLDNNGVILLSGFYESDLDKITKEANSNALAYESHFSQDNWTVARFKKHKKL